MQEKKIIEIDKIENKIQSVGIDLSILNSLVNFLNYGIEDGSEFNNADIANLAIQISRMTKSIISKYDTIEQILDI